jgi:hypothetical protein
MPYVQEVATKIVTKDGEPFQVFEVSMTKPPGEDHPLFKDLDDLVIRIVSDSPYKNERLLSLGTSLELIP